VTIPSDGSVEVGICLFPTSSAHDTASVAQLCEELGFPFVGVGDVQSLWRDLYVTLALVATRTRRIRLGPWVTNPVTRDPTVTANAMLTLHEVSGGRAFLGIGVGDGAAVGIGRSPATLDELCHAVDAMRQRFEAAGRTMKVLWAAAGARSLTCGAAKGDGLIVSGWIVPEVMTRTHAAIQDGLARSGRQPGEVDLIFNTALSMDHDARQAVEAAKPYVARALARPSSTWMPDWTEGHRLSFRERYDYARHFHPEHGLKDLVPDHMVTRKAVAGSPGECLALIRRIRDSGFRKIALIPVGDAQETLPMLAAVLPQL
jgi:5,10-methylenetetrahydromethanopterin reductase